MKRVIASAILFSIGLHAAEPDASKLFAWYHSDGIRSTGATVFSWNNSTTNTSRSLDRTAGAPQVVLVNTPGGERKVLRFDGKSALWQTAGEWGSIKSGHSITMLARIAPAASGFLFDGSTGKGSAPAQAVGGKWKTQATVSSSGEPGSWQVLSFVFPKQAVTLSGLVLGANVAAKSGLACDVAEVLIHDHALSAEEVRETTGYLRGKWGSPTELPADRQPREVGVSDDPRVFHTTIRKQGDDGVHTYRIPGLATTPKGTLIAVFDIRHDGGGDLPGNIDVGMMRSTDDGTTWSPMQTILDFDSKERGSLGNGVGDPAVLVDQKTGHIFVAALWSKGNRGWKGSGPGLSPGETGQFVLTKSTDDGMTWSKPVNITKQVKHRDWRLCFQGPGAGIQLRNGALVFPAQFKDAANTPHSCFIASSDGGKTWEISPAAIPGTPLTSEAQIVELRDGSLLLSMRDESKAGKRAWAKWQWSGKLMNGKWSAHWLDVTDPTCMASVIRHPSGDLVFANPNHPNKRVVLTIRTSGDDGKSWSDGRLLDPRISMYSCLTVLKDGRLGLLYEGADHNTRGLVFARFPLEWAKETEVPIRR